MYSTKEKLHHFRQLTNPLAVEADLALLHEKSPLGTDFTRFDLAPQKNADDILFTLLDVAGHDDIVRNRREFFSQKEVDNEVPTNTDGKTAVDGEDNEVPTSIDGKTMDNSTEKGENKASKKSATPKKRRRVCQNRLGQP